MDSPTSTFIAGKHPPSTISHSGSLRRRSSSFSSSPEFEFWRVRDDFQPPVTIHSADDLFHDGVILPLRLLSLKFPIPDLTLPDPDPLNQPASSNVIHSEPVDTESKPGLADEPKVTGLTVSRRWRDIFKMSEKKAPVKCQDERDKEVKKRGKKGKSGSGSPELNINIWPFSRSRSAGNGVTRPRNSFGTPAAGRKVSSAPCSRSNSGGESKSRKWPSSPGRSGVLLGRSNRVWKVPRGGSGRRTGGEKSAVVKKEIPETSKGKTVNRSENDGNKGKGLNLSVPMCIGYRSRLSCTRDESGSSNIGSGNSNFASGNSDNLSNRGGNNNLFGFRNLFAKKVY